MATRKRTGYELDRSELRSCANWWFWGHISDSFLLNAEISVWNLNHTIYKAASFAANVPDVTWTDGLQGLTGIFFAPVSGLNGSGSSGVFNKFALTAETPFVNVHTGYGNLKENSMSSFAGIYNVLDAWDNVGKGFLELSSGEKVSRVGDNIDLNLLVGLSRMRAEYGVYSVAGATFSDKATVAVTYGSAAKSPDLFRYNDGNDSAVSLFVAVKPTDVIELQLHGLTSFGTGYSAAFETSALAARLLLQAGIYRADLTGTYAGEKVQTVWGRDSTVSPDALEIRLIQRILKERSVAVGLETFFIFNDADNLGGGLWNFRYQPQVDFDMSEIAGEPVKTSLYVVFSTDRIPAAVNPGTPWTIFFNEAGVEIMLTDIAPALKKIVCDYALLCQYDELAQGASSKNMSALYHSIMFSADFTDKVNGTLASVIRTKMGNGTACTTPFGIAAGAAVKTDFKVIGAPKIWIHFTYGMDPYEDTDYTLYRKDQADKSFPHRTFLLNSLENALTESRISIGFIWDIK